MDARQQFDEWQKERIALFHAGKGKIPTRFETWQAATKAEREACAVTCEAEAAKWEGGGTPEPMSRICAAAIRARDTTQGEGNGY